MDVKKYLTQLFAGSHEGLIPAEDGRVALALLRGIGLLPRDDLATLRLLEVGLREPAHGFLLEATEDGGLRQLILRDDGLLHSLGRENTSLRSAVSTLRCYEERAHAIKKERSTML